MIAFTQRNRWTVGFKRDERMRGCRVSRGSGNLAVRREVVMWRLDYTVRQHSFDSECSAMYTY